MKKYILLALIAFGATTLCANDLFAKDKEDLKTSPTIATDYAKAGTLVHTIKPESIAPSFTLGRRVIDKTSKTGIDMYLTYATKKQKNSGGYDFTYLLPIEYLMPLNKESKNLYFGIGGGLGGFEIRSDAKKMSFHGLVATSKIGYEIVRRNKIASFIQLSAAQPMIAIAHKNSKSFAPMVQIDLGLGF
jgi:hypothetical protein